MHKVPIRLNDFKTKVNNLDVGKMEIVPIYLKKSFNEVDKKVMKKKWYNTVNTKVNNL